jgi:isoleucyl-tRNA synthetase
MRIVGLFLIYYYLKTMKKRAVLSKLSMNISRNLTTNLHKVLLENPRLLDEMVTLLVDEMKQELREESLQSLKNVHVMKKKKTEAEAPKMEAGPSEKRTKKSKKVDLRNWNYH